MANAKGVLTKGGQIFIRTKYLPPSREGAQAWVQVSLEDSGPGLPEMVLNNMFKPFNSTKANGEGTGLGLYLAWEVVTQHGGSIQAKNRSEGGAQFIITLPAHKNGCPVPMAA